jgi:AcrR family transcriptional regulator
MASPRVQRAEASASTTAKRAVSRRAVSRRAATATTAEPPAHEVDAVGGPASKRVLRSQGRRTMRRLLDAAMIAFDQRGYYDTRINDVVKIAKTSHGTFYLYFSNKEDLLRALVTEAGAHAQHLAGALDRPPELGGTPQWSDVRGWIALYSDLWIRYAPLFRAWTDLATIDSSLLEILRQTLTLMSDALERQIGLGASDRSIDPHTAGMAVMAMLDRFHYMREFVGQPVDEVALDTLATMIHRSLFAYPA